MTLHQEYHARIAERLRPQQVDVAGFTRGTIAVRLLTEEEDCDLRIAAHKRLEQKCKDEGVRLLDFMEIDPRSYDRERFVQTIAAAFVSADNTFDPEFEDPKPAFEPSQVRGMDTVSVDELVDVYLAYQGAKTVSKDLGPDEMPALIDELKKPGGEALLATLDEHGLRALLMAMVRAA